ncbi:hypothetical protein NSA19_02940 [Actinomyces bowdenii]|uniref:hypothetical protein n=1 Tax=Actinomyces bowdenii TaxID=131109 RepID=UPI00214B8899|nr:hypothetical protein [Actinomyces bowdenii]MCR2051825.1 hypothetical protein [Actinomyces bowdenii]
MRPGPSTRALGAGVAIGARVDIIVGNRIVAAALDVADLQVDWTGDRVVPGQATYVLPHHMLPSQPHDPANNYGQRSHITVVMDTIEGRHEVDLGWWQHETWAEETNGIKVTALDLMQVLEKDPMAWPSSPPSGATVRSELQRLAGTLPVVLDEGAADAPMSTSIQWGHSRTEAIRDLCRARGLEWAVKADGCLHVWPSRGGIRAMASYTGRDLLLDAPRVAAKRAPNRWVVVGSAQGDDSVRWTASVANHSYPYEVETYGRVTDRRELNSAESQAAVNAAADSYRREALAVVSTRSVEIVADPRLEAGDVIAVHTDHGEVIVGRVTAYSLPVSDPSARMRVDLEETAW